ncbi:CRISPR system precrRNA processing endoribonuclease RAMP protein Cas6 [Streptomyces lancefieldiae]|uniref:CRISPR system precrRNA processing endoribonuclease RAMP protein Cas6 n=1 Tax=Streptomyces lancefieldiae TaxID=3075520 RepID=A0ABU3B181_9ACTN|nr:CRISPR system precrRNA processing endoribonuclease RAMP protein Cas6 [Streptomyces sp. DSM 40712]MDT0616210.1 CRISPR system precrRNA processing endoribonuclease RAMP protein Cas6 [Streptomyces sp. DSM 40712]
MPTLWHLTLHAAHPARREVTPAQLHGLACTLLEEPRHDHHAANKPWSVSPLFAAPEPQTAVLRIGWLDDTRHLGDVFKEGRELPLGSQRFTLTEAAAEHAPYEALLAAGPATHAEFQAVTPTYFSRNGTQYPLPDPQLLYGSLARRWNTHAPLDLNIPDTALRELRAHLALSAHDIATRPVHLTATAPRTGYTGHCTFTLTGTPPSAVTATFTALSLYAHTAGIGAQTTHGCGHTQVTVTALTREPPQATIPARRVSPDQRRGEVSE